MLDSMFPAFAAHRSPLSNTRRIKDAINTKSDKVPDCDSRHRSSPSGHSPLILPEQELIDILQSDAAAKDKAITCKRLAVIGTKDATAALGKLLPDPELSSWARIALEAITDPSADQVLRDALDQAEGRQLVGVINSIGVRRDAEAVDGLTKKARQCRLANRIRSGGRPRSHRRRIGTHRVGRFADH